MQPIAANDETKPLSNTVGKRYIHALVVLFQALQHVVPFDIYPALPRELMESLKEHGSPQAEPGISLGPVGPFGVVDVQVAKVGLVFGEYRVETPLFLDVPPEVIEQPGNLCQYVQPVTLNTIWKECQYILKMKRSDRKREASNKA